MSSPVITLIAGVLKSETFNNVKDVVVNKPEETTVAIVKDVGDAAVGLTMSGIIENAFRKDGGERTAKSATLAAE